MRLWFTNVFFLASALLAGACVTSPQILTASSDVPTHLIFSQGSTYPATFVCVPITVAVADANGVVLSPNQTLAVSLGSSGSAAFYANTSDCAVKANAITSISVEAKSANATVYVRDDLPELLNLTASTNKLTSAGLSLQIEDFRVIGQPDVNTFAPTAEGTNRPTQAAIADGKLIVADRLNRRVSIWKAFPEPGTPPDFVLGQLSPSVLSNTSGNANTIDPASVWSDGIRLVVADSASNRVLVWSRFPSFNNQPADFALGQPNDGNNLVSVTANNPALGGGTLSAPQAVYCDGTRLFVADYGNKRVLIWNSFPASAVAADLVLGQTSASAASTPGTAAATNFKGPAGIVVVGTHLYVSDADNARILGWNALPTQNGQAADFVLGQANFTTGTQSAPAANTLSYPSHLGTDGTALYAADSLYSRILVWATSPTATQAPATFALCKMTDAADNLTSASSASDANGMTAPIGVSVGAGRLVVADSQNNRLMVWNAVPHAPGPADYALGQQPGPTNLTAFQANPAPSTMSEPYGIAFDGNRLYLADPVYSRVLVWLTPPKPGQLPDFALGQPANGNNLTSLSPNGGGAVSGSVFTEPAAVFSDGTHLFVSDYGNHRLLIWNNPPAGPGISADVVLGQNDFVSNAARATNANSLSYPFGVHFDGNRLFVVDNAANRVLVWNTLPTVNGTPADFALGYPNDANNLTTSAQPAGVLGSSLRSPYGVRSIAGRLFITDTGNQRVLGWNKIPTQGGQSADFALGVPNDTNNLTAPGSGGPTQSTFAFPFSVVGDANALYVSDYTSSRVLKWSGLPSDASSVPTQIIGQTSATGSACNAGGLLSGATLCTALGLDIDATRLFVADTINARGLVLAR